MLTAVVIATVLGGRLGFGGTRVLFVLGAFAVGLAGYRANGLPLHVQVTITLFFFTPLLRRWVDFYLGYDPSGSMLIAPLLATSAVFYDLLRVSKFESRHLAAITPQIVVIVCLLYGWALSAFQNELIAGSTALVKYAVPILYSMCLTTQPSKSNDILQGAAKTFLLLSPCVGLYGILQHLDPQPWDQMWMIESKIDSIGLPEPGKVRVFGTMNSPVSFASYATCGILLFGFLRSTPVFAIIRLVVAILPLSVALLLTGVRAAWISAAVSLVVCLLLRKTRRQAGLLLAFLSVGTAFALYLTPFGDTIGGRLSSLDSGVSDDGSGIARLHDYIHVFAGDSRYLFGVGFGYHYDAEMNALDGLLLSSAVQIGTVFGVIQTAAVIWAALRAVRLLGDETAPLRIVAGSILIGDIAIALLTAISVGEIGFLYWMLVGLMTQPISSRVRSPIGRDDYSSPLAPLSRPTSLIP